MLAREKTRVVSIGNVKIGGENPIAIQSMCNTKTEDVAATVAQIQRLEKAGCQIIRCTVPTHEAALAIREIKKQISIPLVADIHFDYRMAIEAMENGADKIRINPGNIGSNEKIRTVVDCAKERNIPIRVGVNSGSLEKDLIAKYGGHVTAEGIVESALDKVHLIEDMGYDNLVISIKSSDVLMCTRAHELICQAAGYAATRILRTLGLRKGGIEVVSCPTCGRTNIDLIGLANQVQTMVEEFDDKSLKVAVMGCVVNGPGEAKEADLGIAGGKGEGLLIKKGEIIRKVPEDQLLAVLREEIAKF